MALRTDTAVPKRSGERTQLTEKADSLPLWVVETGVTSGCQISLGGRKKTTHEPGTEGDGTPSTERGSDGVNPPTGLPFPVARIQSLQATPLG